MTASKNPAQEAQVEDELPQGLYRVRTGDGTEYFAGLPTHRNHGTVRVRRGDRVLIEVSINDSKRARIVAVISKAAR